MSEENPTNAGAEPTWRAPEIFNFPPLFTKQVNEQTWQAQKRHWTSLLFDWCKSCKQWTLQLDAPVFRNQSIDREVRPEVRQVLLQALVTEGLGEWTSNSHDSVLVYLLRPQQVADLLHQWAVETGHSGSVLSLYELTSGELAGLENLRDMNETILTRSITAMAKSGQLAILKENGKIAGVKLA